MDILSLVDQIGVKATGVRGGTGPLTLGQLNTLEWVGDADHDYFAVVDLVLNLPAGVTLEDIVAAFRVLLARHEGLRTRFVAEPEPHQVVEQTGELTIDVYEVRDRLDEPAAGPGSRQAGSGFDGLPLGVDVRAPESESVILGAALVERLRSARWSVTDDELIRVAVAVQDGQPVAAALACSHLVVDLTAVVVLGSQFTELAADPARRTVGPPLHQPLDQAAAEREPRRVRQAEASLRFWERTLRWMPQCTYAVPATGSESDPPVASFMNSPAITVALPHVRARTGVAPTMLVTAAIAAVVAVRTQTPTCVFRLIAGNRIGAHLHDHLGVVAQDSLLVVDTDTPSFDELVRRCASATFRAGLLGPFDTDRLIALSKQIEHERGIHLHRDAVLNNIGSYPLIGHDPSTFPRPAATNTPQDAVDALPMTTIARWEPPAFQDILTDFRIVSFDDWYTLGLWTWDTSRVPPAEIDTVLYGVERLLVAAAAGDADLTRLGEIAGVTPVVRDPAQWLRLDSCWVELAEVQRLMDEALAPAAARAYVVDGEGGEPTLVGYLTATDRIATPEQAHTACLAGLPRRYTAMTPRWYVVCDRGPDDPHDLVQWRRQRVLIEGDGRHRPVATPRSPS